MADEMERIEKALEGNGLALSAVAEVLQKMDARLEKEEDEKEEEEELQNAAVEKAALVKELATEVANMLKADQGMDVDGSRSAKLQLLAVVHQRLMTLNPLLIYLQRLKISRNLFRLCVKMTTLLKKTKKKSIL